MTPDSAAAKPIGLGIAGLGMAGAVMVHAAAAHPDFLLRAGADPHQGPREAFARDHNARAYADVLGGLYRHAASITPNTPCLQPSTASMSSSKNRWLALAECDVILAAAGCTIGHTHAFDPAIRLMREIIARGELGKLGLIHSFNYTNYLYRPRRPEELDTSLGGGILFNQVPHQIDTARLLGGGLVRQVRAQTTVLDPSRPTEASCAALLQFGNGATASLVYSGYDHFDSDEWHFGISERGAPKKIEHGAARRLLAKGGDEAQARTRRSPHCSQRRGVLPPHQPISASPSSAAPRATWRSGDGVTGL
jgi:phthalate 4,5-cis-dihydrodiol dehydrogenase